MNKFKGLLLCTDLDGTLYSDDKTVSKENLEAIEYFKSEGGLFTFVTGRAPLTVDSICETVHPNAPYCCLNGGGIYDNDNKKYLWNVFLEEDFIELVKEVDRKLPQIGAQFNTESGIYFTKENSAMLRFRRLTGVPAIFYRYEDFKEPILKVVFGDEHEENILALSELLNNHPLAYKFDFIRSERTLYEILPKNTCKGNGLYKLAELLNIEISKTIAVGDYNNDVSMIKAAGVGFAVSNAVKEAKEVADYITVSNNESAIARIIEGIENGTYKL